MVRNALFSPLLAQLCRKSGAPGGSGAADPGVGCSDCGRQGVFCAPCGRGLLPALRHPVLALCECKSRRGGTGISERISQYAYLWRGGFNREKDKKPKSEVIKKVHTISISRRSAFIGIFLLSIMCWIRSCGTGGSCTNPG